MISAFGAALAAYVILSHQFGADDTKSAWGALATIFSFWLGKGS